MIISSQFSYDRSKVIQALRYHFITRKEIRFMIILVNVFAIISAALFFFKKILPFAFLVSSVMWFVLMITFWFVLPYTVYKKAATFKDSFKAYLNDKELKLENSRGSNSWQWNKFSSFIESPNFLHLYFNSRTFFLIPKNSFETEQLNQVRDILKNNIGK